MNYFICMLFMVFGNSLVAQSPVVEKYLSNLVKPSEPGFAVGVISKGEFVYRGGFGLANLKSKEKITSDTIFRIASTSKQFTAAALQLLLDEGSLNIEDSVQKHFPEFQDFSSRMKIKHLIHHTSGWIDYGDLAADAGYEMDSYYTPEQVLKWLEKEEGGFFEPGEEFEYCNTGYFLMGQLIKRLTEKTLPEFAQERLFFPLGMNRTFFFQDGHPGLSERAKGYAKEGSEFRISMTSAPIVGDGGLMTSVNELKKWDDAYYSESPFPKSFWKKLTTPGRLNSGKTLDYARGLGVEEEGGYTLISHSGSYVGFRAEMMRWVEARLSVVVLANRDDLDVSDIAKRVALYFLPNEGKPDLSGEPVFDSIEN